MYTVDYYQCMIAILLLLAQLFALGRQNTRQQKCKGLHKGGGLLKYCPEGTGNGLSIVNVSWMQKESARLINCGRMSTYRSSYIMYSDLTGCYGQHQQHYDC